MKHEHQNTIDIDGLMNLAGEIPMFKNKNQSPRPNREIIDTAFRKAKENPDPRPAMMVRIDPELAKDVIDKLKNPDEAYYAYQGQYSIVELCYDDGKFICLKNPKRCVRGGFDYSFQPEDEPVRSQRVLKADLSYNAAWKLAHELVIKRKTYYPYGYNVMTGRRAIMPDDVQNVIYLLTFGNGDRYVSACKNLLQRMYSDKQRGRLHQHFQLYGIPKCKILEQVPDPNQRRYAVRAWQAKLKPELNQ